jgi:hypothetical protein
VDLQIEIYEESSLQKPALELIYEKIPTYFMLLLILFWSLYSNKQSTYSVTPSI